MLRDIKSSGRQKVSTIDEKETKLLLAERAAYVDYMSKSLAGILPSEVSDPEVFKKRAQEKVRRTVKKKKNAEGGPDDQKEADYDEDQEDIFFSDDEEDDDVDFSPD